MFPKWQRRVNDRLRRFAAGRLREARRAKLRCIPQLESLEQRRVLTTTVYLDFGLGFPATGMDTNVAELRDVVNSVTDSGPNLVDSPDLKTGLTAASPLHFEPFLEYDFAEPAGITIEDTRALQNAVLKIVERAYAPFDIEVKEASATTLDDVRSILSGNAADLHGNHDAYVFVTKVTSGVNSVADLTKAFGIAADNDLGAGRNNSDELALTFPDRIFAKTMGTKGTQAFDNALAHRIAYTAAHEAAHTLGLRHTAGTEAGSKTAEEIQLTDGDQIRYGSNTRETTNVFTRFDLEFEESPAGRNNNYRQFSLDDDIGLVDRNRNNIPDFAYITGTGAHDHISLIPLVGGLIGVDVKAYSDSARTSLIRSESYVISHGTSCILGICPDTEGKIRIDAGPGNDYVEVSRDIILDATIYGGDGEDTLIGGGGNDWLYGEGGTDFIGGTTGHGEEDHPEEDSASVDGQGIRIPVNGTGQNQLRGGAGSDHFVPGTDRDLMIGVESDDFVEGVTEFNGGSTLFAQGWQSVMQSLHDSFNKSGLLNIPLIGGQLSGPAQFLEDLKHMGVRELEEVQSASVETIRSALYNALGPGGIGFLVDRPDDSDNVVTRDDIVQILRFESGIAQEVSFQFKLGGQYDVSSPIGLDLGIDGLGLTVDGSVGLKVGFELLVGMGLSVTDGFYFSTSNKDLQTGSNKPELTVYLDAGISSLNTVGKLGFLQLEIEDGTRFVDTNRNGQRDDGDAISSTRLAGSIAIDLLDPNGDGRLTISEIVTSSASQLFDVAVTGAADIHLGLETTIAGNTDFPSIAADLDVHWGFNETNPAAGASVLGERPVVAFNNVRLNAGEFFRRFAQPTLVHVKGVLDQVRPVIDFLTQPIPVISQMSGDVSLLDIVREFGTENVDDFIGALHDIDQLVNTVKQLSDANTIVIGSFDLFSVDVRTNVDLEHVEPRITEQRDVPSQLSAGAKEFLNRIGQIGPLVFPLISDPMQVFGLLLGQNVTLFQYEMPKLSLELDRAVDIPIVWPFSAEFGVNLHVDTSIGFGFDTFGLREYANGNFREPDLIFKGFFLSDHINGSNVDFPEAEVGGGVSVRAKASIDAGVARVSASITGTLDVTVGFDLNDPDRDGKIRGHELRELSQQGLDCIFDTSGRLTAGLSGHLGAEINLPWPLPDVPLWNQDFNIASTSIDLFNGSCPRRTANPPVLASVNAAGVLQLHMGPLASLRNDATPGGNLDGDEVFTVGPGTSTDSVIVSAFGFNQEFHGVREILADGGAGNDTILIRPGVAVRVELFGAAGDDVLTAGDGPATLHGGLDNDQLRGGPSEDRLYGDNGVDSLSGFDGSDYLYGGQGSDTLRGGNGTDYMWGGTEVDYLYGGSDADYLYGEAGGDRLHGEDGNDVLHGNEERDVLLGGQGNDIVYGGSGDDRIFGNEGDDWLEGGADADTIEAGSGNDTVYGYDSISGDTAMDGSDTLLGGDGDDTVYGGQGNDSLNGGEGRDILNGESGDDRFIVTFDAVGSVAVDKTNGGPNHDTIEILGTDAADDLRIRQLNHATGAFLVENRDPSGALLGTFGFELPTNPRDRDIEVLAINARGDNDTVVADGHFNVNYLEILGGDGIDTITGSPGKDVIRGGAKGDTIYGGAGEDLIYGGADDDVLDGGDGDDAIYGDDPADPLATGADTLRAGLGRDSLYGGPGTDRLESGADFWGDTLNGEGGEDTLIGGTGRDTLDGGTENDTLLGGDLGDKMIGGPGIDTLVGEFGRDELWGGDDNDKLYAWIHNEVRSTLELSPVQELTLAEVQLQREELLHRFNDIQWRISELERINPRNPEQQTELHKLSDEAQLIGQTMTDLQIYGSIYIDELYGEGGMDHLYGSPLIDKMEGGSEDDHFYHVSGTNFIGPGGESDTISGGAGHDTYWVMGTDAADDIRIQVVPNGQSNPEVFVFVGGEGTRVSRLEIDAAGVMGLGGNDLIVVDFGSNAFMPVTVHGGAGADVISAAGIPTDLPNIDPLAKISVFQGNAIFYGDEGNDRLLGGDGGDKLYGGDGNDTLHGGNGIDMLYGGLNDDALFGGDANDELYGDAANDTLDGGRGSDKLYGGAGDDTYVFPNASIMETDVVSEKLSEGSDTLDFAMGTDGVAVNLDGVLIANSENSKLATQVQRTVISHYFERNNFENAVGTPRNDTLIGNSARNTLRGNAGNDTIRGGYGDDTLEGGDGDDTLEGGTQNDSLEGGEGNDSLAGGSGDDIYRFAVAFSSQTDKITEVSGGGVDTLDFSTLPTSVTVDLNSDVSLASHLLRTVRTAASGQYAQIENAIGSDQIDTLKGNSAANLLIGGKGNDTIFGYASNDTLDGGEGDDQLLGGTGDDTYLFSDAISSQVDTVSEMVNEGVDTLSFAPATVPVTGDLRSDTAIGKHTGRIVRTATSGQAIHFENLKGGLASDSLTGSSVGNLLEGGGGDDTISGGAGNDILDGGAGNNTLLGESGNDDLLVWSGSQRVDGGADYNRLIVYGDEGANNININQIGSGISVSGHVRVGGIFTFDAGGISTVVVDARGGDDVITAVSVAAGMPITIYGGTGNDIITGGSGHDNLQGGDGNDTIRGAAGNDTIDGGFGNDQLYGENGNDTLLGGAGADKLWGGANNDYLDGGFDGSIDELSGGSGADVFNYRRWRRVNIVQILETDIVMDLFASEGDVARLEQIL